MTRCYPARGRWRAFVALLAMLRMLAACSCDDNENRGKNSSGPPPPVITDPGDGDLLSESWIDIAGTAEDRTEIEIFSGDELVGEANTRNGRWETQLPDLDDGEHVLTAVAIDNYFERSEPSESVTIVIDTTPPDDPSIESPEDGDALNDGAVEFRGMADPGTEVELVEDGEVIGTDTANEDGEWSIDVELTDGRHGIYVRSTDEAGNDSRSDSVYVNVDSTAPEAPIITDPENDEVVASGYFSVRGEGEEGAELELFLDGESVGTTDVGSGGVWSLLLDDVGEGEHELEAIQIDDLGNESEFSEPVVFVVDSLAPDAPVILSPVDGQRLTDNTPEITGTATPGVEVSVYVSQSLVETVTADSSGDWSVTVGTPLSEGSHSIQAVAFDGAGNRQGSASVSVIVDTEAPDAPVIVSPTNGAVVDVAAVPVNGTGVGTIEVYDSDGTTVLGSDNSSFSGWSLTTLALVEGEHTLTARAIDLAGNVSDVSNAVTVTVDTLPPVVNAGPDATENGSFTQDATATDGTTLTYQWSQQSGPGTLSFGSATSEDTSISADEDGTYTVRLTVTDAAGHSVFDEMTLVWDTTPPEIISVFPAVNASNVDVNTDVRVTFSEPMDTATFSGITLDDGGVAGTVTAPNPDLGVFTPSVPLSGNTTFSAKVAATITDLAGNFVSAASWDFTTAAADLPTVATHYSGDWNDYVKNDDDSRLGASGTPCVGSEPGGYDACIHVGELLVVDTGDSSCGDKAASDALGAFDWECDDSTGIALMVSTGLADGRLLSDLIDFDARSFRPNSVTVTGTGGDAPFTTADAIWWGNPVALVATDAPLDAAGTVYLVTEDLGVPLVVSAPRVALVVQPGVTLTTDVGVYESVVSASGPEFLWFEGSLDATGGSHGLNLVGVSFSVVRGMDVTGPGAYSYYSLEAGVRLIGSESNSISEVTVSDYMLGVSLSPGSNENVASDVTTSDCIAGVYMDTADYNLVERLVTTTTTYGAYIYGSTGAILDTATTIGGSAGVYVGDSLQVTITDVLSEGNSSAGIRLSDYAFATISDSRLSQNSDGLVVSARSAATVSNVVSSYNTDAGFYVEGSDSQLIGISGFGNGGIGLHLESADRTTISNATLASNAIDGVYCAGCINNVLSGITAVNNGSHGVRLSGATANVLQNITAANNGADGVHFDWDDYNYYFYADVLYNLVQNVVTAHNADYGLALFEAPDNTFTGVLKVGDNGAGDCYVDAESMSGDLADDAGEDDATHDGLCNTTGAGLSDFTLATGVSLAQSFVGKVGNGGQVDTSEDADNPHDDSTPGTASYASVTDFTSFENLYRGWGKDGSAFPNANHRAHWTSGTGRIWDFSAALGDTGDSGAAVLLQVAALPTGDDLLSIEWWRYNPPANQGDCTNLFEGSVFGPYVCTSTFVRNAVELSGDGIGNDNLLCESDETCLFMPNVGSYQGHGALGTAGAFVNGTVTGVTLQEHASNGY